MDLGVAGKVVVVTGGTRGIGLQVCQDFLEEGAQVAVIAKNQPSGPVFTGLQEKFNGLFHLVPCDVTDRSALKSAYDRIMALTGRIDVVVSNVGNGSSVRDAIPRNSQWNKIWDINFNSALYTAEIISEELIRSKGSLLFISSIAGMEFIGAPTDYSTAKSALLAFSKTLSHKLAPDVRVNVICPGNVLTEEGTWRNKLAENPEAVNQMLHTRVPLQRFGTPAEISKAVLFLSSQHASFITGACLVVDGGQTISF